MSAGLSLVPGTHDEAWHARRFTGIGGSEAPIVAGVGRRSAVQLWQEKRDQLIPDESETPLRMRLGNLMEPVLDELFEEATGLKPRASNVHHRSKSHPYMVANVDRFVPGAIVEYKTRFSMDGWADPAVDPLGVPPDVMVQVQHIMAVTRRPLAYVFVLFGMSSTRPYRIPADDVLIRHLETVEGEFWQHVQDGTEPPVDGSEGARGWLSRRFPKDSGVIAPATSEEVLLAHHLRDATRELAEVQGRVDLAENEVRNAIGDRAGIEGAGFRLTWKVEAPRTEWKAVAESTGVDLAPLLAAHLAGKEGPRVLRKRFDKEQA